jgi:competence protein ComEC
LAYIFLLFLGYYLAFFSLLHLGSERTRIGDMVGWEATTHTITGTTQELLSTSEFAHKYRVTLSKIDTQTIDSFDVSLSLPPNLSLLPGDTVTALGKFSFPQDTSDYMAEKQLWYRWIIAEFHTFHTDKIVPEKYGMFVRVRQSFDQKLRDIFPPRGHEVLSGIILWQKNNLDPELKNSLKSSGLMHIMVVSGSNVMMLIIFLSLFLRSFHPWIRIVIISLTILGFVLLVGGDTPVWRAALMGVIGYSAGLWWYRFSPLLLPLLVASILALINPLSLAYDIGFQLSFLSVICIIAFGKQLTKFFHFLGGFFDEAMSLTIAATIGTFPITLFYFGTFSLVGPIANLFAAPAIPILMYGGIVTLLVSTFSSSLAYFFWYIPWVTTTYLLEVISFFGNQSWSLATIQLGQYRGEFMIVALSLLVMSIVKSVYRKW